MAGGARRVARAQAEARRRREAQERRDRLRGRAAVGDDTRGRPTAAGTARGWTPPDDTADRLAEAARLRGLVDGMVRLTDGTRRDDARLETHADMLVARAAPSDPDALLDVATEALRDALVRVRAGGWPEPDVRRLVERTLGPPHLRSLDALATGRGVRLASVLGLAALLVRVPLLEATALLDAHGAGATGGTTAHPKLARVRALLAKAESTPYPEEAELLSAKAQELVARYALDGLLEEAGRQDGTGPRPQVRRLWLDAPYVEAKAALVSAVASANRCRTAVAAPLGFCLVVGDARDLLATELLVTSLLVQAGAAMLSHERVAPSRDGRTRSFRRAFLLAYAHRVGERLAEATAEAYREAGGDALPVVAAQEERVTAAFEAAVPHTVSRRSVVSNDEGWLAGRAAADRAHLDVAGQLED
ncbi:DUF2786 domain-containing protein [Nocardioides sp. CFH 31398]|uniref:DUF2786 domain-containing protein n=1 Tax=Nocardioides sp. CFH 31398 TaxID=2919579 RepID=UPI001F058308|nr:DUF2786 domain-containing protein [Nocardioides sp. CFH 31398]MCH1867602.1 DUF2786 domain-containing protein [Nocardioides sp. CFH 31398]